MFKHTIYLLFIFMLLACTKQQEIQLEVYETAANGNKLQKITDFNSEENSNIIELYPDEKLQTIVGFGGAFTESSAYLLNKMSQENRNKILEAYFDKNEANYSLTRTHINSCDFSLSNYSYAPIANDKNLEHFTIDEDRDDLIPMIKDAMKISKDGFKIIASPWTAPPWMKDNNNWVGGKLLPQYRETWALFFSKYLEAYETEGIKIWGITAENEPNGNGNNWESMHFSPKEMTDFVKDFLGPELEKDGYGEVKILGYDQNRGDLKNWVDEMYKDKESSKYYAGTAIHWYESTYDYFPEALQYAHKKAPEKYLIQTEACVDAEIPHWQDDAWYWSKEATDWGWDWASAKEKYLHPKYVPTFRYARDIIGCLNNYVNGWVDWNMILDKQGGPNWFKNWCIAPIIVDPEKDEIYVTPIYYVMAHFSKFIRPDAKIIKTKNTDDKLMVTAAQNPDKSIAVVVLNQEAEAKKFTLILGQKTMSIKISGKALQTIIITN